MDSEQKLSQGNISAFPKTCARDLRRTHCFCNGAYFQVRTKGIRAVASYFYLCIATIFLSPLVMVDESRAAEQNIFEKICDSSHENLTEKRKILEKKYPIGSDSSVLDSEISKNSEFINVNHAGRTSSDYKYLNRGIKKRFLIHKYYAECDIENNNKNIWQIFFLSDENRSITLSYLWIVFKDQDFSTRNVKFSFQYIWDNKEIVKALWSITGKNTTIEKIGEIMTDAGAIFISKVRHEGKTQYQYRRKSDDVYGELRRIGISGDIVVIWYFDDNGQLNRVVSN